MTRNTPDPSNSVLAQSVPGQSVPRPSVPGQRPPLDPDADTVAIPRMGDELTGGDENDTSKKAGADKRRH